jgi:nucleotide-binding universal stress UspA family protein
MALFDRIVVPVADADDVATTVTALSPYLSEIQHITVVHVIEKGGGVADKAPMEKRAADAAKFFSTFESHLDETVAVETRIEFGATVAETIIETALDTGATAIVFCPRGGNRLVRFLSGDTAARLVSGSGVPVVSLNAVGRPRAPSEGGDGT